MNRPTTPQKERVLLFLLLALTGVLLALAAVFFYVVQNAQVHRFFLIPMVAIVLLTGLALFLVLRQLGVAKRHIAPDGGHWCQCTDCERTGRAVGPTGKRRRGTAPTFNAVGAAVMLGAAGVVAVAWVPLVYLTLALDGAGVAWFLIAIGVLLVGLLLALALVNLSRAAKGRRLAADHGCTCRWCGAPARPV